jgi:hypothetical protein
MSLPPKEKLLDRLLTAVWLFENIFWKYSDRIVYNAQSEKIKNLLYNVYWLTDVYIIFPHEVDEIKTKELLKTMYTYYEPPQQEEGKSLFSIT